MVFTPKCRLSQLLSLSSTSAINFLLFLLSLSFPHLITLYFDESSLCCFIFYFLLFFRGHTIRPHIHIYVPSNDKCRHQQLPADRVRAVHAPVFLPHWWLHTLLWHENDIVTASGSRLESKMCGYAQTTPNNHLRLSAGSFENVSTSKWLESESRSPWGPASVNGLHWNEFMHPLLIKLC